MRVVAILPDYSASATVNVIAPLRYLHKEGQIDLRIFTEDVVKPKDLLHADVVVFCRNTDPIYQPISQLVSQLKIPMIYDLDDNLFDVPEDSPASVSHNDPRFRRQLEQVVRQANLVRVHSPVLKEIVETYNSEVNVVWAAIEWSLVPEELPSLSFDPIKLMYAVSPTSGTTLFPLIRDDIFRLLRDYESRIHAYFLGYNPPELAEFTNVSLLPFDYDYETFYRKFAREGYAIGLAPMRTETFYQCKTDIKYRDYAAAGAVGVYQDCPLYRANVKHLETGLLVSGESGSWYDAISMLLHNPHLIQDIRQKARQDVQERHRLDVVAQMWLHDLCAMPTRPPVPVDFKLRKHFLAWHRRGFLKAQKVYRRIVPVKHRLRFRDWRLRSMN